MNGADVALELMDALAACLTAELTERGTLPCSLSIIPGVVAYPDKGCGPGGCGMAWVRCDRIYGSKNFPIPDATADCNTFLAGIIELGILRCVPTLTTGGQGPSDLEQTNAAISALDDASALIDAIACCGALTAGGRKYVMGAWEPRDAADMGGGLIQVTVMLRRVS